jgi:hypothetical protein
MSSDSSDSEQPRPRPNIWALPDVIDVKSVLVRFKKPLIRYHGRERVLHEQAIELMVHTNGPIPERAISPVLMVGDVPVADYEHAGKNLYRFYAFDTDSLHRGAPIKLAWPDQKPRPERKIPIFELRGEESR